MSASVHDCWNRIGVSGDGSCPELRQHIHCRNCPVYAAAARQLLDVAPPADQRDFWTQRFAAPRGQQQQDTRSVLVFRCATEWFALPTATCVEVASTRPIRRLPHRRDAAVLGLTNVRGELMVCVSLGAFLRLPMAGETPNPRLLVVRDKGEPTALHVDEVHGTYRYAQSEIQPVPDTIGVAAAHNTHATLRWCDRTVGLLDSKALLSGLDRCVA